MGIAILIVIAVPVVVLGGFLGYGLFEVWYGTANFRAVNHPSFKPQEKPGSLALPLATATVKGKEARLASREEAKTLKNPISPTVDSLKAGKKLYLTFCAPCHGKDGKGQGLMGTVPNLARISEEESRRLRTYLGKFLQSSTDLNPNFVLDQTDGEIYYTITYGGYIIMPGFKDALSPEQRWHLINYIKRGL